jgi:hypothetical protein
MRRFGTYAAIVVIVLCAAPDAQAWCSTTHVELARTALANLGVLPAAIAALLARHRIAYIYGNIAADLVFAKKLSRVRQFCHHWSTGFRLLDSAPDDSSRAFAYGYLSHLAADTVAHGQFVPRQVAISGATVNFGHLYWELRADALLPPESGALLREVIQADHSPHHRIIEPHLDSALLSFELNRRLFDRITALIARPQFRRTVDLVDRCSRWYLSPTTVERYRAACVDRIQSVLCEGDRCAVLHEDPNGNSALMQLRVNRRDRRRRRRWGLPNNQRVREATRAAIIEAPMPLAAVVASDAGMIQPHPDPLHA